MLDAYADRWALVTGASSGIGAEFARQLAARGMHLAITARREDRLEQLARELHTRHGAELEILPCDLSVAGASKELTSELARRGRQIELLVNNAGFAIVGNVEETSPEEVARMIQLNIGTVADLTCRVLPEMLERRHGAVINVSSLSAFQPVAWMGAYAASKSWALHFSEALWAEVRDRGVTVLAVCPGVTQTEFFQAAGIPGWLDRHTAKSPQKVVKRALRAMEKRRQYVVPGWKDYLMTIAVRLTTRRTAVNESARFFRPKKAENNESSKAEPSESESEPSDDSPVDRRASA